MCHPQAIVTVAESLIRDLGRVSEWCDLWGMKLNASKTKTMIVSRSRTIHPQSPTLTIGGTVLKDSDDLVILGVTFNSKTTFSSFLKSLYLEVLASVPRQITSWKMHSGSCLARLGVLFCSVVLLKLHTLNYWTVQSVVPGF